MALYLITGGAGFIGSHLADALLADGHRVRVLDDLSSGRRENLPPQAELIVGSVLDRDLLARAMEGIDGCFHLAAVASVEQCTRNWVGAHAVNVTGAISVFDTARATPRRPAIPVVYASSAAVFGTVETLPLDEASPTIPISAYGADKLGCELHARVAWLVHGLPSVGFRFFNVYGPRQDPSSPYSSVISVFAGRMKAGQGITIFGDGNQTRDFVYISDAVACLQRAMYAPRGGAEIFVVATGLQVSLLELAAALGGILNMTPDITFAPLRAGDIRHSAGSPEKLERMLGCKPSITVAEGLRRILSGGAHG
jgi:UDP-glucose 4-epimerase